MARVRRYLISSVTDLIPNYEPTKTLRERWRQLGPTGLLGLAAIVFPLIGMAVLFSLMATIAEPLRGSLWGPIVCVFAFAVLGGFALLPTAALSIFAGWAFHFGVGYPTALAGFFGASIIAYAVSRQAAGDGMVNFVEAHPRWAAIERGLLGGGTARTIFLIALLRLTTVPPFAATTVALAALGVKRRPFLIGTLLGIAPRTAVYVLLASNAEQLDPKVGETWVMIAVWGGLTLVVFAIMTLLARRALAKMTAVRA